MKFDTILEYQNIDRELLALENEFSKSKERAVYGGQTFARSGGAALQLQ